MTRHATLLAAASLLTATLSATAPTPASYAVGDVDTDYGRMVLVLDSSGSMKEPAGGGETKIQAARKALRTVVDDLPDDAAVGLRVFGAKVFSRKDKGACDDTQLVVKPATGNRDELRAAIGAYKPYGETPIPAALKAAAADLGGEGKRSIVLVSDGESTCDPDPCEVAGDIADQGLDLQIDVVGLSVSGKARNQLQCVAKSGHGTYYDADDAGDLAASLERISSRALQPFTAEGTPVTGTEASSAAPTITAGTWLDQSPLKDHSLYYLLKRQVPGSTVRVGVANQPGRSQHQLGIHLLTPTDQDECGWDYGESGLGSLDANTLITASAQSSVAESDDECRGDTLLVKVESTHWTRPDDSRTPMQIVVTEEPPADDVASLPPPVDQKADSRWTEMAATGTVRPTSYGTTFSSAAPLSEDGIYRSSIAPGEVQLYKVPVDWGQALQVEVRVAEQPALAGRLDRSSVLTPRLLTPTYARASMTFPHEPDGDVLSHANYGDVDSASEGITRAMTYPVRYRNREKGLDDVEPVSVKGDYYLMLTLSPDADGDSFIVPMDIVVKRVGTAGEGTPTYADGSAVLGAGAQPADEDESASADPEATAAKAAAGTDTHDGSGGKGPVIAGIGAGALALGGIAAGVLVAVRRRRTPASRA